MSACESEGKVAPRKKAGPLLASYQDRAVPVAREEGVIHQDKPGSARWAGSEICDEFSRLLTLTRLDHPQPRHGFQGCGNARLGGACGRADRIRVWRHRLSFLLIKTRQLGAR